MGNVMVRKAAAPKPDPVKVDEMTPEEKIEQAVDALPTVTFSGAVSAVVNEAVEGYRWANRLSRADVVKDALTEWCDTRDLLPDARAQLVKELTPVDESPLDAG